MMYGHPTLHFCRVMILNSVNFLTIAHHTDVFRILFRTSHTIDSALLHFIRESLSKIFTSEAFGFSLCALNILTILLLIQPNNFDKISIKQIRRYY